MGQWPRHAVARPLSRIDRRGVTGGFLRARCPLLRGSTAIWTSSPGGRLVLYSQLGGDRSRARAELADADVAITTSYCPDAIPAGAPHAGFQRAAGFLRSRYAGHLLPGWMPANRCPYLPEGGLGEFDLVLSYTGGDGPRATPVSGSARAASRRSTGVSIPPSIAPPTSPSTYRAHLSYLGTYAADRQPGAGAALHRPGTATSGAAVSHRRSAVPAEFPVDAEHLLRPAPSARRAPRLLLLLPADAERHPPRDGRRWDTARPAGSSRLPPAVRRSLSDSWVGAGRVLRARSRDPDRARTTDDVIARWTCSDARAAARSVAPRANGCSTSTPPRIVRGNSSTLFQEALCAPGRGLKL